MGKSPYSIYVDKGLEFNSNIFKTYRKEHKIKLIFSQSITKAALVESSQRTLQGIMFRFMDKFNTNHYIDHLQDIVSTYNCKINRTIKTSPNHAYLEKNRSTVMKNLEKPLNQRK